MDSIIRHVTKGKKFQKEEKKRLKFICLDTLIILILTYRNRRLKMAQDIGNTIKIKTNNVLNTR